MCTLMNKEDGHACKALYKVYNHWIKRMVINKLATLGNKYKTYYFTALDGNNMCKLPPKHLNTQILNNFSGAIYNC